MKPVSSAVSALVVTVLVSLPNAAVCETPAISGRVTDENGVPLSKARVHLVVPTRESDGREGASGYLIETGEGGSFSIPDGRANGPVEYRVERTGFLPALGVLEGDRTEIALRRAPLVTVRVVHRRVPIRSASILLLGAGETGLFLERKAGLAVPWDDPRAEQALISAPGFRHLVIPLPRFEGKAVDLGVVELSRGRVLSGRVTAYGRPVEGAEVSAPHELGREGSTAVTDALGRWEISGLSEEDPLEVIVEAPDHAYRAVRVGTENVVDIELKAFEELVSEVDE